MKHPINTLLAIKATLDEFTKLADSSVSNVEVDGALRYCLSRNIGKLDSALSTFHKERDNLIKKHGKAAADGSISISPKDEAFPAFALELGPMALVEEEVDLRPFTEETLSKAKGIPVNIQVALIAFGLVKEAP